MKKRLISLMLAGAMLTGVGSVAGCGGKSENDEPKSQITDQAFGSQYKYDDVYIILEQNGKNVLHHGDVKQLPNSYIDTTSGNWLYDFDCAEPFVADWQHAFFEEKPSEDFYAEECEDCLDN